jgi:hypothetical protein
MKCPETIEGWLRESIDCYSQSIMDHIYLEDEDPVMFLYKQYPFAADYACIARGENVELARREQINNQVLAWFGSLPDRFDQVANESDFAFSFCYLFANHLLGYITVKKVWKVLGYLTTHWEEAAGWVELPEGLY